eukprot:6946782-Alexandrium_andersonii.AAC.1
MGRPARGRETINEAFAPSFTNPANNPKRRRAQSCAYVSNPKRTTHGQRLRRTRRRTAFCNAQRRYKRRN